jgi:soluble lytic murein transglycosylase-like protein
LPFLQSATAAAAQLVNGELRRLSVPVVTTSPRIVPFAASVGPDNPTVVISLENTMLKSVAYSVTFSALIFGALAQPASASWLFDDGINQHSGRAAHAAPQQRQVLNEASAQVTGQVTQVPGKVPEAYQGMVAQHASANGVPTSLIHRVIMRESRYNPHAVSAGNYGLMQIRLGTARAMGYSGSAAGLLDAETNMTYAVRYLAGAYRAAHGNEALAVALYARGYYGRGN